MLTGFCQQSAKVWEEQFIPGGSAGGDPLADLSHPLLALALQGQGPPTRTRSPGRPEENSLRSRERDSGLGVLVHGQHVSATLIDKGHHTSRIRQTKGMRQLVRQRQGLVEAGQGLLWIPQQPEGPSGKESAGNTRIVAHAKHWRTAQVWRVACAGFLQMRVGNRQRTKAPPRHPKGIVGEDRERAVFGALRQAQKRFPELSCSVELCSSRIKPPQTRQDLDKLWRLAHLLTQRVCLGVGVLHFGRSEPFSRLQCSTESDMEGHGLLGMLRRLWQGLE